MVAPLTKSPRPPAFRCLDLVKYGLDLRSAHRQIVDRTRTARGDRQSAQDRLGSLRPAAFGHRDGGSYLRDKKRVLPGARLLKRRTA